MDLLFIFIFIFIFAAQRFRFYISIKSKFVVDLILLDMGTDTTTEGWRLGGLIRYALEGWSSGSASTARYKAFLI